MAWRDSAIYPQFWILGDARIALFLLLFMLHMQIWTAVLLGSVVALFGIISHFGWSLNILFYFLRGACAGNFRHTDGPTVRKYKRRFRE